LRPKCRIRQRSISAITEEEEEEEEEGTVEYERIFSGKNFSLFDPSIGELFLADGGPYVETDVTSDFDRITYLPVKKDEHHYLMNAHCFKRPPLDDDISAKRPKVACFGQLVGQLADGEWGVVGAIKGMLGRSIEGYPVGRWEAIDNEGAVLFHLRTLKEGETDSTIMDYFDPIELGEMDSANNVVYNISQVLFESDYEDDLSSPTNPVGHGIAKLAIKAPTVEGAIGRRAFGVNGIIQTVAEDVDFETLLTGTTE
jgi:hypothetical protein